MKINTALILCAGFGKRLNPITLNTPKPLLEIKDLSMLERCINLIEKLGIEKILINTFYLRNQFSAFLNRKEACKYCFERISKQVKNDYKLLEVDNQIKLNEFKFL